MFCPDYDAPLSEGGDYTDKYDETCQLLEKYQKVKLRKPERPEETKKVAYNPLNSTGYIDWNSLLSQVVSISFYIMTSYSSEQKGNFCPVFLQVSAETMLKWFKPCRIMQTL